jgi:dTDP-4-dehydrorhamnose reductase
VGREPAGDDRLMVLLTGGAGLVAGHLLATRPISVEVVATRRSAAVPGGVPSRVVHLDRRGEADRVIEDVQPDVVVHTAYSIDRRPDIVDASANVAAACRRSGVGLVHLSSDTVFGGEDPPYGESDPIDPVNDYGKWKAEAEQAVLTEVSDACITRTSLVVSMDPPDRGTRWLFEAVRRGERPMLFRDEIRCPVRAVDLAASIWALLGRGRTDRAGVWHLPGPEPISRLELGMRLLRAGGVDPGLAREGSLRDHPSPRPRDLTLVSSRPRPGPEPSPVP